MQCTVDIIKNLKLKYDLTLFAIEKLTNAILWVIILSLIIINNCIAKKVLIKKTIKKTNPSN